MTLHPIRSLRQPAPRSTRRPPTRLLSQRDFAFLLTGFQRLLPADRGVEPHLRGVIEDTLAHPGNLLRSQVAFALMRAQGSPPEAARTVAVAVEYFHTASLIFDDLPSMDDARERRGHPCPHLVHGEAAATLGALALITQGYALLWQVLGPLEPAVASRASGLVSTCLGVQGVLNGQARDLHFATATRSAEEVLHIAEGKTVSLIRLALILPAVLSGADETMVTRLDRLATVWGLSYQILDDCKDCWSSRAETGKSTHRDVRLGRPNLLAVAGARRAMEQLEALIAEAEDLLAHLPRSGRWRVLPALFGLLLHEQHRLHRQVPAAVCA